MPTKNQRRNPASIAPPARNLYSHAVESPTGGRVLHIAGQVGVRKDGTLPDNVAGQTEQIMANLGAILADADMGFEDVVKINGYLLKPEDIFTYAAVRNKYFASSPPATTAVVVVALASPDWLVEIDAVAVKHD